MRELVQTRVALQGRPVSGTASVPFAKPGMPQRALLIVDTCRPFPPIATTRGGYTTTVALTLLEQGTLIQALRVGTRCDGGMIYCERFSRVSGQGRLSLRERTPVSQSEGRQWSFFASERSQWTPRFVYSRSQGVWHQWIRWYSTSRSPPAVYRRKHTFLGGGSVQSANRFVAFRTRPSRRAPIAGNERSR